MRRAPRRNGTDGGARRGKREIRERSRERERERERERGGVGGEGRGRKTRVQNKCRPGLGGCRRADRLSRFHGRSFVCFAYRGSREAASNAGHFGRTRTRRSLGARERASENERESGIEREGEMYGAGRTERERERKRERERERERRQDDAKNKKTRRGDTCTHTRSLAYLHGYSRARARFPAHRSFRRRLLAFFSFPSY